MRPTSPFRNALRASCALGCAALALAGCTVGPDFVRPAAPEVHGYTSGAAPAEIAPGRGGASQRVVLGQAISADWWGLFRSERLDAVLESALEGSKTIAAARATLAAARENVLAARGGYWPSVDASASVSRSKNSSLQTSGSSRYATFSSPAETLYSLGPTVSYAPDVFGATARQVEQQQALADLQRYELGAAYLTLSGNAVTQAISIASLRAQIEASGRVIADDERNLELVKLEYEAGRAARADVLTAQTQLESDRTQLPPLRQQLSAARHALAILTGRSPAQWSPPDFDLADFRLPGEVPLSLPSTLVRQRPDILAAEAQLHADSAAIGVATANLYPSITLSGSIGQRALDTGSLFNGANQFWNIAAQLAAPLFHGGTLEAQRRAAIDTYRSALASYEQTVLQAFQQVADSLRALQHDAELLATNRQLLDTSGESLALQRESYEAGKSTVLELIVAERAYQQALLGVAKARAQRLQNSAQLVVALGGGWWQAKLEATSP